jgi:Pectate lyase superfamily protein
MRRGWIASSAALLFAAAAVSAPATAQSRPASYAEFDLSVAPGDAAALRAAIVEGKKPNIYLQRGHYFLDNPVVIDRTQPLFVHGADRAGVILSAKNPTQPLLVVRNAPLLNFAGLSFFPTAGAADTLDARAIRTENTQPVTFEIQDCGISRSMLEFAGPGTYRVQSSNFSPLGRVRAPLVIDHPGADVLIFGGDVSNGPEPLHAADYAHVWQKRGRLRIYATTFEGGLGPADVRIEAASALGPHVIANTRSEGVNGALAHSGAASRLLYVPPTSERVDVLLKGNGAAWETGPTTSRDAALNCKLVAYHGAGTLWLLGNRAEGPCGRHLVEGDAPQATIVSVGNLISSPQPFPVRAARILTAADAFNNAQWTGLAANPATRWIPDGTTPPKITSYPNVPQPPDDALPAALERPVVTTALPGMVDVKSYGAIGNGTSDDTAAIQRALDADCDAGIPKALFLPAGTYRIRNTLFLNHHAGGNCRARRPAGGWIAGAGSGRTILAMDPGVKKGVFATDGLAFATVQGITFDTWTWREGDPTEPNVDLELYPGFVATQQNNFYDVVFDGGHAAFAAGVRLPTTGQCSSNVIFRGRFANAHIGMVSGHYNALANGATDSEFVDNDYALGAWTTDPSNLPPGGTFFAYRSTSRGTRTRDFLLRGSANGSTFYAYEWISDAPAYFAAGSTATSWPMMFDRVRLTPRPGAPFVFDVGTSQGPYFLYSSLDGGGIRVGQSGLGQSYAVKMQSEIPTWATFEAPAPNGQLDEISWGGSGLGAPGQPAAIP